MAQPNDAATTLQTVSAIQQTQYFPNFLEQVFFSGEITNMLFKPAPQPVVGTGMTFQVERGMSDSSRTSNDMLSDPPSPNTFDPSTFIVRANERDASASDLVKIATAIRVSIYDIMKVSSAGAIIDIAETLYSEAKKNFDFKLAALRHNVRGTGVALVNATPVNNDSDFFGSASAYTTGSTSCRFQINSGSVAYFQPNYYFDFYNGSTLVASNMRVTDYNPADTATGTTPVTGSVGITVGSNSNVANCDGIVSGLSIYYAGTYNSVPRSLGDWFTRPATGDSFIGGLNRTLAANRYLVPISVRASSSLSARKISKFDFDDAATAISYRTDAQQTVAAIMQPNLVTALRQDIGEAAFIQLPPSNTGERDMGFGSIGLNYQHPSFGKMKLLGDPLAKVQTVRFMVPGDWITAYYGNQDLTFMPGEHGIYYRIESSTPGQGKSMFFQADGWSTVCDVCLRPSRQVQVLKVNAA